MAERNKFSDLVGAAAKYTAKNFGRAKRASARVDSSWQETAWGYWDDTPEVRFAGTWIGNSMGRARLFAGRRADDGSIIPLLPEHEASILVKSLAGGATGQSQMLTEFGPHLVVAGEAWIVIVPTVHSEKWHLVSVLEAKERSGSLEVEIEGAPIVVPMHDEEVPLADNDTSPLAIRVWQPHPRRHIEADSPIRSSFTLLDELRLLNAAVAAITKSRLTGRGIVFIPQGTKFPTAPGNEGAEDDLLETLLKVAEIAYTEPDSAAAAVPIFLEVPADFIGQIQKMTFESNFDEMAIKLREETIRRFASGLDTPAEVLLGMGEVNHWGNWAIEEAAIRVAVEPKLATICDALTSQWLQPALTEPDEDVVVWYDTSDLRVKLNRGETSIQLYDRGEITGDALRRETQFDDADKPNDTQRREAIITGIIKAAPSLAPTLLPLIGIEMPPIISVPGEEIIVTPPDVELPVDEEGSPPVDIAPQGDIVGNGHGLHDAADGLIWRALERAGQRIRTKQPRTRRPELQDMTAASVHVAVPIAMEEIDSYGLLDDAWDRVPEIATRYSVNADCLAGALDEYCRDLIAAGVAHGFGAMPAVLNSPCLTEPGAQEEVA